MIAGTHLLQCRCNEAQHLCLRHSCCFAPPQAQGSETPAQHCGPHALAAHFTWTQGIGMAEVSKSQALCTQATNAGVSQSMLVRRACAVWAARLPGLEDSRSHVSTLWAP